MTTVCSVSGSYGAKRSTTERMGWRERGERKEREWDGGRGEKGRGENRTEGEGRKGEKIEGEERKERD